MLSELKKKLEQNIRLETDKEAFQMAQTFQARVGENCSSINCKCRSQGVRFLLRAKIGEGRVWV